MSLWDELPGSAGSGGALDTVESVLKSVPGVQQTDLTDDDGTWHIYTDSANVSQLGLGGAGTAIEFRDPNVTLTVGRHVGDDGWRIDLKAPVVAIALPFLTPARYDVANALLVPDTSQRGVFLVVGGLTVRLQQLEGQDVQFSLVSASTSGNPTDKIYDLIRMEPGYAIVGPGNAVGFGFRGAVLDLSDKAGPPNLPAGARTMPNSWQGFFLPEIRLFVQPNGLDGLHVTAAARDLYIGVGASAGVTGIFEVEVVNGASLSVEASFLTPTGPVDPCRRRLGDGPGELDADRLHARRIGLEHDHDHAGQRLPGRRGPRGDHDGRRRHVDHRDRARRYGGSGQDPDPAHQPRGRRGHLRVGIGDESSVSPRATRRRSGSCRSTPSTRRSSSSTGSRRPARRSRGPRRPSPSSARRTARRSPWTWTWPV